MDVEVGFMVGAQRAGSHIEVPARRPRGRPVMTQMGEVALLDFTLCNLVPRSPAK